MHVFSHTITIPVGIPCCIIILLAYVIHCTAFSVHYVLYCTNVCVCVCVYLKMAVDSIVIEGSKDRCCHGNNGSSSCLRMCVCVWRV